MKLSLGAGTQREDGWTNVDYLDIPETDIVHNLIEFPWPFDDESVEEIKAIDVLEHLPSHTLPEANDIQIDSVERTVKVTAGPAGLSVPLEFVKECHRILEPGGILFIQVPHWLSPNCWTDLTHTRGFTERSMNYFDDSTDLGKHYGYYSNVRFNVSAVVTEWTDPDTLAKHAGNCQFTMVKRTDD